MGKNNRTSGMVFSLQILQVLFVVLLLSGGSFLQSCRHANRSEADTSSVDSLQESMGQLDKEIEELRRRKQELDQELKTISIARWEVVDGDHLRGVETFGESTRTAAELTAILNRHYDQHGELPNPMLKLVNVQGNTAQVQLQHAEYLTQQMGSAGAAQYMAEVTFTLTSIPDIDTVHFDFEEGDHAVPGNYTRKSWEATFNVDE